MQAYKAYKLGGKVSELLYSPALYGIDLSAQDMPKPRARSSPMMAVVANTLWLFGGTVEVCFSQSAMQFFQATRSVYIPWPEDVIGVKGCWLP